MKVKSCNISAVFHSEAYPDLFRITGVGFQSELAKIDQLSLLPLYLLSIFDF